MDDGSPKRRVRVYVPGEWKRRGRVDPRSKSHKIGRPREKFLSVDDPLERERLRSRAWHSSPERVAEQWRAQATMRNGAQVMAELSRLAYDEWFEALDDELPPGIELTHVLWGAPS